MLLIKERHKGKLYGVLWYSLLFYLIDYKKEKYAFLLAAEPSESIDEDEVVIFRISEDGQCLEPIEDENLLEEVFEFYQQEIEEDDTEEI